MVVEAWLARAAAARPDHNALRTPAGSRTYAELHRAALAVASELAERGAERGVRVAIALPGGLAFAETLHACLLLGAVAVPIDTRLAGPERDHIAGGCAVLVEEPLEGRDPARLRGADVRRHDLAASAAVIHTSGTTSAPRPIELTYGNLLWSALGSAVALGSQPSDRWLCALPLSHVGGLSILLRSALYATSADIHERFETDHVLHALRGDATLVSLVATTLARLLDAGLRRPPALRCALTGGGPVPTALLERAEQAGVPVGVTYGLTETCSQVTTTPAAEMTRPGPSAGPPLFCTQVSIAEDHEILVRGPTVAPAAAAPDGWLRTGDLGRLDERGRLHVSGRKSDTIVSGGENVAPVEVEAVLESHPGVAEAAVVGREDGRWGEAVTAIVVASAGSSVDAEQLRAHCRLALAPFKVPKVIEFTRDPLPRTRSGKLLRRAL